jgi:hypothetical protein
MGMHSSSGEGTRNASDTGFPIDVLIGLIPKEIVRRILSESGYEVYPFETLIDQLQQRIRSPKGKSATTERFFSKPDLLVLDPLELDLISTEVKFRNREPTEFGFKLEDMRRYLTYWRESIIVAVTPSGRVFYAQRIEELASEIEAANGPYWFDVNLDEDFNPLEEMFPRSEADIVAEYRSVIGRVGKLRSDN